MTKHELLTKCIAAYEDAIDNLPEVGWLEYLDLKFLEEGICHFIENECDNCSVKTGWIRKYYTDGNFWYTTPNLCATATEAKETLQYRLNILKQELSITEP